MGDDLLTLKDIIENLFSGLDNHSINFQVTLIDALEDFIYDWLSKRNLPRTPVKKWKQSFGAAMNISGDGSALLRTLVDLLHASTFFRRFLNTPLHDMSACCVSNVGSDNTDTLPPPDSSILKNAPQTDDVAKPSDDNHNQESSSTDVLQTEGYLNGDSQSDETMLLHEYAISLMEIPASEAEAVQNAAEREPITKQEPSSDDIYEDIISTEKRSRNIRKCRRLLNDELPSVDGKSMPVRRSKRAKVMQRSDDFVSTPPSNAGVNGHLELGRTEDVDECKKLPKQRSPRQRSAKCVVVPPDEPIGDDAAHGCESVENIQNIEPCNIQPTTRRKSKAMSELGANSTTSPSKSPTVCEICGVIVKALKSHMWRHQDRRFKCPYCDFSSRLLQSVNIHVRRIHTNYRPHLCEACGKAFVKPSLLNDHIREKHTDFERVRAFKCRTCSFATYTRTMLARHELKHQPCRMPEFKCDVCGARLMTVYSLREHKRLSHVEERPFPCNMCSFSAKSKKRLRSHMKVHGEKLFECETCMKRFTMHAQLVRHQLVHSGSRPFGCPYCGYRAGIIENLRKHCVTVHKEVYPPRKRDVMKNEMVAEVAATVAASQLAVCMSPPPLPPIVATMTTVPSFEISTTTEMTLAAIAANEGLEFSTQLL